MERKTLTLDCAGLKFDDGARRFSGYASVFNGIDSVGDTVLPGAYAATLKNRERPVAMRWNHFGPVIGKWLRMEEDETGLFVEGELTPGHSTAEDAYALLKHGAISGLSIGYRLPPGSWEANDKGRLLKAISLVEISVVEEPADNAARVADVKSAIDEADSLKEIEAVLREAGGFSRTDATALVSRIKSLSRGERVDEPQASDIVALIRAETEKLTARK